MSSAAVGGLMAVRDPGARESYSVIHIQSGIPVVLDLAGPGSAIGALLDIVDLVDWSMPAPQVADAADLLCYVEPAVERAAAKFGGVTLGELAVYA